jgi:microcystin-dependent protein
MSLQNCSNCYNGCTEIVSDKCVRYTGIDVPVLGIQTGDSLSYVEQALITFLTSTLDGTGIKIDLNQETLCDFVKGYLPTCGDITLVDVLNALTESVCFLKDEVLALEAKFAELEQGYAIECLEGSPDPTSTYEVLQATINKLCQLETDLAALALDVDTNYVKLADLDALIQAYLDSISPVVTQQYEKMVPFTVLEYYGDIAGNFDGTGAGILATGWDKVYLCNGLNGTPDKRGRSPIGSTSALVGGGPLDPIVAAGPAYGLQTIAGESYVTLATTQIPAHSHVATVVISDPGHTHLTLVSQQLGAGSPAPTSTSSMVTSYANDTASQNYDAKGSVSTPDASITNSKITGIGVTVTNSSEGGGQSHNNIHPVISCYYIMYIP